MDEQLKHFGLLSSPLETATMDELDKATQACSKRILFSRLDGKAVDEGYVEVCGKLIKFYGERARKAIGKQVDNYQAFLDEMRAESQSPP